MRTITPSSRYSIRLPDDVRQEWDEEVLSIWRDSDSTVLQLSSYCRESGSQITARQRLADRMAVGGTWRDVNVPVNADCEVAGAQCEGEKFAWWHIYLVTPRLALYATISFPCRTQPSKWAVDSIREIQFGEPVVVPV
jgi:hypothetical protein